jgi:hypothetical protein
MLALKSLLMILGIGLFGSAATVVAYDVYIAARLRWLLRRYTASTVVPEGFAGIRVNQLSGVRSSTNFEGSGECRSDTSRRRRICRNKRINATYWRKQLATKLERHSTIHFPRRLTFFGRDIKTRPHRLA